MATTAATQKRVVAVAERHASARQSLMLSLLKALLGLWGSFDRWDDRDMVEAYAARSATLVDITLLQSRRLGHTYAKTILSTIGALPVDGKLPAVEDVYPRSGTTQVQTYSRVAETYLWKRKQGLNDAAAKEAALDRLAVMAETDVMLGERDETQKVYAKGKGVIGHRRIIHPELSKSGYSCGLCVVASDQLYKVAELMPIHDRCNCTDMAVTRDSDPGSILNRDDLERLYAANGGTYGRDLRRLKVGINEHGEVGPILVRVKDHFTDVTELNERSRRLITDFERPTIAHQRDGWQAQVDDSTRAIQRLRNKAIADPKRKADYETAIGFQEALIGRYRGKLRASA
jgi:hypothetical protein